MERNREKINENGKINEYITVLQGYLDNEEIEYRIKGKDTAWYSISSPTFDFDTMEYRIKPIPAYRPYTDDNEAFTAMQEHQQFGWLYNKIEMCYQQILCIGSNGISTYKENFSYEDAFKVFIYSDNSTFGIKLDEKD